MMVNKAQAHGGKPVDDASTDELAEFALAYCLERSLKIAAAESLTGGLLADAFVRIPGASRVFLGSAVTYDIRAKASILHVDSTLLERQGAVCPEVARQMALGAARLYAQPEYGHRIFGFATTGVAGPGPDENGKPAGLVYVAMAVPSDGAHLAPLDGEVVSPDESPVVVRRLTLQGSRERVRQASVHRAVQLLTRYIRNSQE